MGVLDTFRLDGKVALVTGGSRGLGLQIAEALGEAGAAVALTARREEGLQGAVVNFTRALAATLAEHNITVNCICPGFFPTKMTAATLGRFGEEIAAATPLRRVGGDTDLKGIAVLFASDASAFITGQVIAVD